MAVVANIGSNDSPGVGKLPTPVLLALIGGGIGAVVLIMRKTGGGGADPESGTLLPNTAIMLGSLQQTLLDLTGQTGKGFSDLSSQLTGTQESLAAQMDALTSQAQQGFTTLQSSLLSSSATQTDSILQAFQQQGDALTTLIQGSVEAQRAYDQSFHDSVQHGFDSIVAAQNGELAALNNLQTMYSTDTSGLHSAINDIAAQLKGNISAQPGPWSAYNGKIIAEGTSSGRTNPSGSWTYYVSNGKLYGIGDAPSFLKLTGMSATDYARPGAAEQYVVKVQAPDSSLRSGMTGVLSGGNYLTTSAGQTISWGGGFP